MSGDARRAAGTTSMPAVPEGASAAVRAIARVLLAGVLLLTVVLAWLRQIGWIEMAFFWIAAIALYLIVTGVQGSPAE